MLAPAKCLQRASSMTICSFGPHVSLRSQVPLLSHVTVRKLRLSEDCGPQLYSSQGKPQCAARRSGPGAHTPDHEALLPVVSKLLLPQNPFFRRNGR